MVVVVELQSIVAGAEGRSVAVACAEEQATGPYAVGTGNGVERRSVREGQGVGKKRRSHLRYAITMDVRPVKERPSPGETLFGLLTRRSARPGQQVDAVLQACLAYLLLPTYVGT